MITLDSFTKRYEHRATATLSTPRLIDSWEVEMPIGSVIHYVSDSQADIGIRGSHPLLAKEGGSARIAFTTEGYGSFGNYSKLSTSTSTVIRAYRASQKGMQYFGTVDRALSRDRELTVIDYSLLTRMYRYTNAVSRFYDEWRNITTAMISQINDPAHVRNHFIQVKFPTVLPSESDFKMTEDEMEREKLDVFTESSHFWLREIRNYMLGKEEILQVKEPKRLWFVFTEGRSSVIISAAQLKERGETQVKKLFDMFESILATRPGADTDALAGEDTSGVDIKDEEQIIPGTPNSLVRKVSALAEAGKLTPPQARAMINVQQRMKNLPNPFDPKKTIAEASKITPEMVKVNEKLVSAANPKAVPAHALRASTNSLYADYVKNGLYEADILNMLQHFAGAGVMIQDIKKEDKIDALNDAMVLKVKLLPVNGKSTTIPMELFNVNPDGTFRADGVLYAMDSQKVDLPIRKTHAHRAALTSYFGKLFIQRSELAKYSYSNWIRKNISSAGLLSDDTRIQNIRFGENHIPKRIFLPRAYTAIMTEVSEFKSKGIRFNFEYKHRDEFFGEGALKKYEKNGHVLVGRDANYAYTLDMDDKLHRHQGTKSELIGDFMESLGGGWGKRPQEFTELKNLKGKRVPIGVLLAYSMSFSKLVRKLGVKYRNEPANVRSTAKPEEFTLTFSDYRYHFTFPNKTAELIMTGFVVAEDILKGFNAADLNRRDSYTPIFKSLGLSNYHLTEIDLIEELFVDPITKEVLEDMKEPTDILDLYIRCSELVQNDEFPDETDPNFMRERRLERIPGFVYSTMVKAVREQRNKPNPGLHPVYVGPRDVWTAVTSDSTCQLVKELNPIHTLKQLEAVSLSGEGGRAAETLVKSSRAFHENDVGRYSADTPDSGKVGIRTFAPPNTRIRNQRGLHGDFDFKRDGATSVLSTTGLILPAMHHDDQHRVVFKSF